MKFAVIVSAMAILVSSVSAAPQGGHGGGNGGGNGGSHGGGNGGGNEGGKGGGQGGGHGGGQGGGKGGGQGGGKGGGNGGSGGSSNWGSFNWNSVNFQTFDYNQVDWSQVDFSTVPYNKIDWNQVNYGNKGLAQWDSAFSIFSSSYVVAATPGQVVNGTGAATTFTGGLPGTRGRYTLGIISASNTICYKIELTGFYGQYQSLANTATHLHEAYRYSNGPPRIVFPNPVLYDSSNVLNKRISIGCMNGPFTTGLLANGIDSGFGFHVRQIEANPSGFFTDVHSSRAVPGAVRGQLA
ncbi:hypothetical protein SCUP515_13231 [Seiridium cupressi]